MKHEGRLGNQMSIRQTTVDAEIHRNKTRTENYRPNTTSLGLFSLMKLPFSFQIMHNPFALKCIDMSVHVFDFTHKDCFHCRSR